MFIKQDNRSNGEQNKKVVHSYTLTEKKAIDVIFQNDFP